MKKMNYLSKKNLINHKKHNNVLDLIRNSRLEQKREKRQKIVVATVAASALALSGYIISQ